MFGEMLNRVREKNPLVHCITNYVTANDCANLLLACGASPIMADDPQEAEEIASRCDALTLNLGTLQERTVTSMIAAGKTAHALNRPIVLDPVGAGASRFRTESAAAILHEVRPTAIRGNLSELKALILGAGDTRGVDAGAGDQIREDLEETGELVRSLAKKAGCVVAATGAVDLISDGHSLYRVRNGDPMMGRVTGTGCQLSSLTAAFLGASPERPLEAVIAAVCAMGVCGELARQRLSPLEGNLSYRDRIIDAMFLLNEKTLEEKANVQCSE